MMARANPMAKSTRLTVRDLRECQKALMAVDLNDLVQRMSIEELESMAANSCTSDVFKYTLATEELKHRGAR